MPMQSMKLPLLLISLLCSWLFWPDLPLADTTWQEVPQQAAPPSAAPQTVISQTEASSPEDTEPTASQPEVEQPEAPQQEVPQPEDHEPPVPEPEDSQEKTAEGAKADASQALVPGGTVRLKTTLPPGSLKGIIKSLDDTQVTVLVKGGEELSVPWPSIKWLDVQVGVRHRYGMWALIGGGIGAFFGLFIPNHEECFAPGCPEDEMFARSQAVIIGGVLGALTGLVVEGTSDPSSPKWERLHPPIYPASKSESGASVGLRLTPDRDGPAVRVVLSF